MFTFYIGKCEVWFRVLAKPKATGIGLSYPAPRNHMTPAHMEAHMEGYNGGAHYIAASLVHADTAS